MKYQYSLINYQRDLYDPESVIPVGVLVESWNERGELAIIARKQVQVESADPIESALLNTVFDNIRNQIESLQESDLSDGTSTLNWLAQNNSWSMRVEEPSSIREDNNMETFQIAMQLFYENVLRHQKEPLVRKYEMEEIRLPKTRRNLSSAAAVY